MANRPVTVTDLELHFRKFKLEILKEISLMVSDQPKATPARWLKNKAAAALLGVSLRTLQDLRDKGIVPHSRIGRIIYYDPEDIQQEIERRKSRGRSHPELNATPTCSNPAGRSLPGRKTRKQDPASGR
ncbi:MAG TPA: helix-turn-helix domain-containing protein [Puia sp.]|uniref:helix-turn-helix domain-containing protein n=1 Tax=Puia sp. TaxID=2045100 RepID=UPI002D0988E8|nr:helix-turn-helix domain-containing protein [Puia sp.]HVU97768.1 helix-turn-helix domain-containing protein [Puia sp.]